jgi:prepilin-type N-terminal cleavage/methylation domain-containing protein
MNFKCLKAKWTSGFSLIELMVVIAIVALLTAIAVPSYKNYLAQSKVAEIFSLASDQMTKYQNLANLGSVTSVTTTNLGSYIATAIQNNTASAIGNVPANSVGILLNTTANTGAPSIDPTLSGLQIRFVAANKGTVTGDTTNTTVGWTCTFVNSTIGGGSSAANIATVTSLLSPGNCTGV